MKKLYLTGAMLASALAIAGCNKAADTAPANTTSNATAPAAPAEGNAAGGEEGAAPAAPAGDQTNQNFTLNNNTGHTVVTLNVSPSNSNEWGEDILGRDTLANGESAQISFPRAETQCQWDIRATYDDGDTTDARGVNLCELSTVNLTAE
ncbi:MAG: hypothetical protein E6G92_03070 [Alphaproteobacteria bacterium]|nr:MAG: hypothetical protein E6G92_03070 [Alphaproteobacteria bacterium]